jgi:pimeloyl-ACP methyl ester carboxylesterase
MILSDFHFYSPTLGVHTAAYVLLPEYEPMRALKGEPLPTLYLLHGLSDDHTGWMRQTAIARYASRYAVAVVMPAVNRSFYTDMAHGPRYWSFVSEELPDVMETYFPLSKTREGRFAAGLSMGGYGALHGALRSLTIFSAASRGCAATRTTWRCWPRGSRPRTRPASTRRAARRISCLTPTKPLWPVLGKSSRSITTPRRARPTPGISGTGRSKRCLRGCRLRALTTGDEQEGQGDRPAAERGLL